MGRGEQTNNQFGDYALSLQTIKYRNGNIMAFRFEKREPNGQYLWTDCVWNLNERKMAIKLCRVYSESATAKGKQFSPPTFFPGRLVLHSRAKKALKDAAFENVELVYQSFKLPGITLWEMKNGSGFTRAHFDEQCAELGIEPPQFRMLGSGSRKTLILYTTIEKTVK